MTPAWKGVNEHFDRNPIRTISDRMPDAGHVHMLISDQDAGLFARAINEMADKISGHHKSAITRIMLIAHKYGPLLHDKGICKITPSINNLMTEPEFGLKLAVPNYHEGYQKALINEGILARPEETTFQPRRDTSPTKEKFPAKLFSVEFNQLQKAEDLLKKFWETERTYGHGSGDGGSGKYSSRCLQSPYEHGIG